MTKRLPYPLIILLLFCLCGHAQQIDSTLARYAEHFTPEKVHLHLDRGIYSADETVYFKAYVMEDHDVSTLSKTLYIDFYNGAGKLLQQNAAPLIRGSAKGSFTIPSNYMSNAIVIKAYTKWMLNFDTALIYSRSVSIRRSLDNEKRKGETGNNASVKNAAEKKQPTVDNSSAQTGRVHIFPEGGFAVEGLANRFAFAAVDKNEKPKEIKGVIKSSSGKKLDSVASVHDGMGSFKLVAEKGETYNLEWKDDNNVTGITPITIEKKSGLTMRVDAGGQKTFLLLQRSTDAGESFKLVHLLVHQGNLLRYKLDINMSEKTKVAFDLSTSEFQAGIVQLTLFNNDWVPVSERLMFAGNKSNVFQPEVHAIKKDLGKKGKNEIEIFVPDTMFANMSVAVTDAAAVNFNEEQTIFSDLLLTDEIKGKVNNPAYYFRFEPGDSDVVAANLDLLMLTHGHRRYDWDKIAKGEMPVIQYPAETDYLGLKGKISNQKLVKGNPLMNVIVQGKDNASKVHLIPVDKSGVFEKRNIFFYDTVQVYYGINGKKSVGVQDYLSIHNNLFEKEEKDKFFAGQRNTVITIDEPEDSITFFAEQERIKNETTAKTLREVVVSSKVKTKIQQLDNFYTHGVFAGEGNNYMVDVEGDETAKGYTNIFTYLQSKLPGLSVKESGPQGVTVTWFRAFELVGRENPPYFFLDEVPMPVESIVNVSISDIAYVKGFRPPFVGAFLNGATGAIAIYTKKGYNPVYNNSSAGGESLTAVSLEGYTKFREFTQPDYSDPKSVGETDYRATLYWNPYVFTDKSNPRTKIEFYNNDISRKLVVILEGINLEGKMARVVKVLE